MNIDCWSHIGMFLSLKDLINIRHINTEIHSSTNYRYEREKRQYLHKCVMKELIRKRALKDWIHRSPLLCCLTGDMTLMTSRFGCSKRFWDPPLGWYSSRRRFNRNCLRVDSDLWGSGAYIDNRISGWNRTIWENRMKFMRHGDSISNIVSTARDRIYQRKKSDIWNNFLLV